MKWTTLTQEQFTRLAECRSLKSDIVPIACAYVQELDYYPDTALEITLEHLDSNGQFFDLSEDDWTRYLKMIYNRLGRSEPK